MNEKIADPSSAEAGPRVLVVDDDPSVAAMVSRVLRGVASAVSIAGDAPRALERLASEDYDVVVSDLSMPGMSGTELLQRVREHDLDLPLIILTGAPSIESAAAAVELNAFRYLMKPTSPEVLRAAVREAAQLRALARAKSEGLVRRDELEAAFRRALQGLEMAYQPIVSAERRVAIGHEALMRSKEKALPSPPAVLDAAEKLGELHTLGRHTRALVAADLARAPVAGSIFVNLHSADLADPELYDPGAPLSRQAKQIVLELTERASLEALSELDQRLGALRGLGYRLAVDDLGAGYAGLSYFARIRPEIVKIDMSLVRNVHADPIKQRVVLSLATLASQLGMEVVAEGVETTEERDTVVRLGCTFVQGYGLARPGPPYPEPRWA